MFSIKQSLSVPVKKWNPDHFFPKQPFIVVLIIIQEYSIRKKKEKKHRLSALPPAQNKFIPDQKRLSSTTRKLELKEEMNFLCQRRGLMHFTLSLGEMCTETSLFEIWYIT